MLEQHVYVDDALARGDTLEEALDVRNQLIGILKATGMDLDKWSVNHVALLSHDSATTNPRRFSEANTISALGLLWNPRLDCFTFKVKLGPTPSNFSKRTVLSEVASLFDPLGWLAPVIVVGKLLLQQLRLTGMGWDEPLDTELAAAWSRLRSELPTIEQLQIPR